MFLQCSSLNKKIQGLWLIEEFKHRSFDELDYLSHNLITFNKMGECFVPSYNNKKSDYGKWEVLNSKLKILNTNSIFDGQYEVSFKDNEHVELHNRIIFMKLKSVLPKSGNGPIGTFY